MKVEFVQEKRGEIERIQREFANRLSADDILKGTATAINSTLARGIANREKGLMGAIERKFNITKKYLKKSAKVSQKATQKRLWGAISVSEKGIPVIAFGPKQVGSDVSFIRKKEGREVLMRDAFIATMTSGHRGVFSRGKMVKGKFVHGKFDPIRKGTKGKLITERNSTTVYSMAVDESVENEVVEFIGTDVTARVHGILTSRVNKIIASGNF